MEASILSDQEIATKIYYIRGQKVMVDSDLAKLYKVETKNLNKAVDRNIDRFPEDFMFQLTEAEFQSLRFQIGTSKRGGRRYAPYVFTEHGVLMLSSVLNSQQAIQVNIRIMRVFARVRQILMDNTELRLEIEKIKGKLDNQDKNMEIVFRYLDELSSRIPVQPEPQPRRRIGFKTDES